MSRRKTKTRKRVTAKVTAASRHAEHDLHQHADDGGPVPEAASNEDVLEVVPVEAAEAAARFSRFIGKIEGVQKGLHMPRTAGERRALDQRPAVASILQEVFDEAQKALSKHGPQNSPHEGYAVIAEEVDELWDEIKADRGRQKSARAEAIQIAAMAVRYVLDLDPR